MCVRAHAFVHSRGHTLSDNTLAPAHARARAHTHTHTHTQSINQSLAHSLTHARAGHHLFAGLAPESFGNFKVAMYTVGIMCARVCAYIRRRMRSLCLWSCGCKHRRHRRRRRRGTSRSARHLPPCCSSPKCWKFRPNQPRGGGDGGWWMGWQVFQVMTLDR